MRHTTLNNRPVFSLMKQSDTISFFHLQMPRWLFCDSKYQELSLEAKVAYTFLLNRFQLSRLNGWINEQDEVFIIFTRESLAKEMQISARKATDCFKELSQAELIWERRMGRGYPNQIYLASVKLSEKDAQTYEAAPFVSRPAESAGLELEQNAKNGSGNDYSDTQNPQVLNCENDVSRDAVSAVLDLQKSQGNKIEMNNIEDSDTENSQSDESEIGKEKLLSLLSNCGLEYLPQNYADVIQNAIERLWYADQFAVDGVKLPREKIRTDLLKLHSGILLSTVEKLQLKSPAQIRNPTAYTMAALLNNVWEYASNELLDPERREIEFDIAMVKKFMTKQPDDRSG